MENKESLPRKSRRKHEPMSGRKKLSRTICRVLVSLQVWPNMKWEKWLGDKEPAYKMTVRNESEGLAGKLEKP